MTECVTEMAESVIKNAESVIKPPGNVTREEFEAALLRVHAELAEDRKRITMIEEFARELFSILWVKFRSIRTNLDEKVRGKFSSILTLHDEM